MYKRFVGGLLSSHQAHACQTVELKTIAMRMAKIFEVPRVTAGKRGSYSALQRKCLQLGDDCVEEG